MNNILKITVVLLLFANTGFTQQNKLVTKLPEKGTLQQSSNLNKTTDVVVLNDSTTKKTFDVAEGKKGLNAVNVKRSKQSEVRANAKTAVSPETDSATDATETKHAINTKGTGATRDK
jgi:hypothetical protein